MPEVLEIERASFEFPWDEEEFLCCLRQINCTGMVAEEGRIGGDVVGFMIYERYKGKLRVVNFAVHPKYRSQGHGRAMAERLIDKLSQQRRKEIVLEVRETNLPAQCFWRAMGFRYQCTLRNHYEDTVEDAYVMAYRLGAEPPPRFNPKHRFKHLMEGK